MLCSKDVISHFLCGSLSGDYSDAAGAGLIDYRRSGYDRELMELYEVPDALALLPPLRESCEVVGLVSERAARLTGLTAGIFDVVASAIGSGVVAIGDAPIVAGTWSINQVVVVDRQDYLRPVFMNFIIEKDRCMAIEASATSAANLDWFVREFADGRGGQGAARSSKEVASVLPDDRLPLLSSLFVLWPQGSPRPSRLLRLGRLAYPGRYVVCAI